MSTQTDVKTYQPRVSNTWWLRNRRYSLYMLRELTALPITLWLLSLLIILSRLGAGPSQNGAGYRAPASPVYVAFSVICLLFALLHSLTWLSFSGVILRVPMGERDLPPRVVTAANYALWGVATVAIGALLILLGR